MKRTKEQRQALTKQQQSTAKANKLDYDGKTRLGLIQNEFLLRPLCK